MAKARSLVGLDVHAAKVVSARPRVAQHAGPAAPRAEQPTHVRPSAAATRPPRRHGDPMGATRE